MPSADPTSVTLRPVVDSDFEFLFELQADPRVCEMSVVKPRDRQAFQALWEKQRTDPSLTVRAILNSDQIVGTVVRFPLDEQDTVGYLVHPVFWGRGIATSALQLFLKEVPIRPLFAAVATTNAASLRVMLKCGFQVMGTQHREETDRYPACDEVLFRLER